MSSAAVNITFEKCMKYKNVRLLYPENFPAEWRVDVRYLE